MRFLLGSENNVIQIVRLVKHRSLEPIIVFSFSKKECEIYALQLAKFDFTTGMLIFSKFLGCNLSFPCNFDPNIHDYFSNVSWINIKKYSLLYLMILDFFFCLVIFIAFLPYCCS